MQIFFDPIDASEYNESFSFKNDTGEIKSFCMCVEYPSPYCDEELIIKDISSRFIPIRIEEVSSMITALTSVYETYLEQKEIEDVVNNLMGFVDENEVITADSVPCDC